MGRSATLRVDILADARGVGKGVSEAEGKLGKLGKLGKGAGLALGAGLAVAGAAALKFAGDAVSAASDVQQSFGALDTIYGKNAAQVKKWANDAADAVGLSASKYAELSGLVGAQLQNMGVSQEESAKRSKSLIEMGSDLAATYGGSVADAVSAVSSLLKGEADPIERYGVGIKQADVSARMAAMGLGGLTGAAEKQARAQATLALLTEQTAKTQGAFSRESNTLAGQQERLRAKYENIKATVGKALLPVLTRLFSWMNGKLLPGAQRLGAQLSTKLGPAFRRVGAFITTHVVPAARQFINWYINNLAPGIRRAVIPVIDAGRRAFDKIRKAVQDNRPQIDRLIGVFRKIAEFIANNVLPIIGRFAGFLVGRLATNISSAIGTVGGVVDAFVDVKNAVSDVIDWIGRIKWPSPPGWLKDVGGALNPFSAYGVDTIGPHLTGRSPSYAPRQALTSAALGTPGSWATVRSSSTSSSAMAGPVYVDARTTVQVDGALDPDAVARQIEQLLTRRARRLGRQPLLAGGGL